MTFNIGSVPEFDKDLKRLSKKYRTLDSDFETFQKALAVDGPALVGVVRISGLGENVHTPIYKARKFYCQELRKTRSGFRVIYAHVCAENKITLLEMYHKNKQENEDKKRVFKYFGEPSP
ncbi:MAG: hypothetical protein KAW41_04490 [Candidatus Diapherotrites archaeon]|nr:hypothetical protein [Candidatus Diapherotrites archaeon]